MKSPSYRQYEAVIFDMDGVLIDSEPLWKIAMEKAFKAVGCTISKQEFQRTVGLRLDEVIRFWYAEKPWDKGTPEELQELILRELISLIKRHGEPLPGVLSTLQFCKNKGLKIGLATSSYHSIITVVLDQLKVGKYFDCVRSAQDETYGKPHPAVYLSVAEQLQVPVTRCLVIEDSFTGFIAAKAARMDVCVIPEKTHTPDARLKAADYYYEDMGLLLLDFQQ